MLQRLTTPPPFRSLNQKPMPSKNLELARQRQRKWKLANPDVVKRNKISWLKNNPNYYINYYYAHREEILKKQQARRLKNLERERAQWRTWAKSRPDIISMGWRKRRAKLYQVEGSHTQKEWGDLKDYYGYTCLHCGRKEPTVKLTQDHIVPISKGGSDYISNIQSLCQTCNSRKHNKLPSVPWEVVLT